MTETAITARRAAAEILTAVLEKSRPLDEAFDRHERLRTLESRDRAFTRLLVATTLRRLGEIEAVLDQCLRKPVPEPLRLILRIGACQLLYLDTAPYAAVDSAVEMAKADGFKGLRGLVNAVLRRLSREGASMLAKLDGARINTPDWLWQSWSRAYGEDAARAIASAHLVEAPLDITVAKAEDAALWAERLGGTLLANGTVRRAEGGAVDGLPGFADGAWWVQDAASSMPARLFGDVRGKSVLDLCAAPGGKTAQLAAAGAQVTAVDRAAGRMRRLQRNFERLRLDVTIKIADAAMWRPDAPADAVLVDAPCSGTGTIRRHPDIARLKTPRDVRRLADLQRRLLAASVDMVKPGGTIVYSTCSLEPEEGERQIEGLLASGAPVERVAIDPGEIGGWAEIIDADGALRSTPAHLTDIGGIDGFYAARLRRLD